MEAAGQVMGLVGAVVGGIIGLWLVWQQGPSISSVITFIASVIIGAVVGMFLIYFLVIGLILAGVVGVIGKGLG
jgi:hypothetical protein